MERQQPERQEHEERQSLNDRIIRGLEAELSKNQQRALLYKHASQATFDFVEGEWTGASDTPEQGDGEPLYLSETVAEQNELMPYLAETCLKVLCDGLRKETHIDNLVPEHAIFRRTYLMDDPSAQCIGSILEVHSVRPDAMIDTASFYILDIFEHDDIQESLIIGLINGSIVGSNYYPRAPTDKLRDHCYEMFGTGTMAHDLLFGRFQNEEELESKLKLLCRATVDVGVYSESYVEITLAAIRTRGMQEYETRQRRMQQGDTFNEPSIEKLREFAGFLGV